MNGVPRKSGKRLTLPRGKATYGSAKRGGRFHQRRSGCCPGVSERRGRHTNLTLTCGQHTNDADNHVSAATTANDAYSQNTASRSITPIPPRKKRRSADHRLFQASPHLLGCAGCRLRRRGRKVDTVRFGVRITSRLLTWQVVRCNIRHGLPGRRSTLLRKVAHMAGVAEAAPIPPPHAGDLGHVEYVDVLIVGQGFPEWRSLSPPGEVSGQNLRNSGRPKRDRGTWDLFRYPGVRSDSDMHTLGYPFRPWRERKAIADGSSIRKYIEETAQNLASTERFGSAIRSRLRRGRRGMAHGRSTRRAPKGTSSGSPATSFACVAATMTTPRAICQAGRALTGTRAASCTRRAGPKLSTTTASELL